MTTFKGVNRALIVAAGAPGFVPVSGGLAGGKVAGFYDQYAIPASGFADGDKIELGLPFALKKGDVFLDALIWHEAMGGSVVAGLGDDGSATRYASALDVAAAGSKVTDEFAGFGYVLTQDRPLLLTLSGAAPTATKIIKVAWRVLRA